MKNRSLLSSVLPLLSFMSGDSNKMPSEKKAPKVISGKKFRPRRKGLTIYEIDGFKIEALNLKNAMRKVAKLKQQG